MQKSIENILGWLKSIVHEGAHLRLDSRQVSPGDVFVAIPGVVTDGRNFIRVAAARGAAGALIEARHDYAPEHYPLASLEIEGVQSRLGDIAAAFYGFPSKSMQGVAVTGTNGKTTISHWVAALLSRLGTPCAAIGTIGCYLSERAFGDTGLTTPDAISLQGLLVDLKKEGAQAFAIEASSIGLEQGRLKGTSLSVGIFTNLTRDHLDYHKTLEAYAEAKRALFTWPSLGHAVINADDPYAGMMADAANDAGVTVWATSMTGQEQSIRAHRTVVARNVRATHAGMAFDLVIDDVELATPLEVSVLGAFNVSNLLSVIAAALALGYEKKDVLAQVAQLMPPAGRMQQLIAHDGLMSVVDYSHTPDALEKSIDALRPLAQVRKGALWVVFGCGGDRDPGKRPLMGEVASRLADNVTITSDNPRGEDPMDIIKAIAQTAPRARLIESRREAIHQAVQEANPCDIVLIAGKGHETYQDIKGVKYAFSDVEVVREAFNERKVRALRGDK